MPSDLYSIVDQCQRTLDLAQKIAESCDYVSSNLNFPIVGSVVDYDQMLRIVFGAWELTQLSDKLRVDLDSYLKPYDSNYQKLGLKPSQQAIIEAFVAFSDKRPFHVFSALYEELGRPQPVVEPILVGEHVTDQ